MKVIVACLVLFNASFLCAGEKIELSLEDLKNLNEVTSESYRASISKNPEDMRKKAMRKAALSLGAQSGFSKRISELQDRVLVREKELDDIYDFSLLMKLDSGVSNDRYQLPPVLRIAESRFTKSSDDFITTSGVTYEIVRPAKLVSSPPNWRQFLIFKPNSEVRMPHQVLMPKNDEERELWAGWIQDGWVKGMEQADFEMTARISELGEVFVGMVKYARLVKQGVIRPAVVTESNQSIVGGGSQMVLDQTQIRISAPATMNTNTREWEAVVVDPRESLRYPIEKKNNNKVDKADVNE